MGLTRTADRNREIFASFNAGQTVESLAEQHGLSAARVRALLIDEKHRHEVSPEGFYRTWRDAALSGDVG
jgi:Mor family transcriptional regulator